MSKLATTLHDFTSTLSTHQFALVGGLAVSARTEPRFTRDIDLAVAVASDADAESCVRDSQQRGFAIVMTLEHGPTKRLATVRLRRGNDPYVDLMFASCGIEPEVATAATALTVLGQTIPVASVAHLIAMKLLSRDSKSRPRDDDDLAHLSRSASDEDWHTVAQAIALIEARGFARGRDLRAALDELRQR